jgi:hypothetical protein
MQVSAQKFTTAAAKLRGIAAEWRVSTSFVRLRDQLKAGFRTDQPRVPAGQREGGRWTTVPGWAGALADGSGQRAQGSESDNLVHLVGGRRRSASGRIRVGERWISVTPAQQVRVDISLNAMRRAVNEVQKIDRNWRPRPQAYETVEGLIRANEATRVEAELRSWELSGRNPNLGPFFGEMVPGSGPGRLTASQKQLLDEIGRKFGCHGCGSKTNLTPRGHFIGDHYVPYSLGTPTGVVPHCQFCSASQGGLLRALRWRMGQ